MDHWVWPLIWAATMAGWIFSNMRLLMINAKWRELFDRLLSDRSDI